MSGRNHKFVILYCYLLYGHSIWFQNNRLVSIHMKEFMFFELRLEHAGLDLCVSCLAVGFNFNPKMYLSKKKKKKNFNPNNL